MTVLILYSNLYFWKIPIFLSNMDKRQSVTKGQARSLTLDNDLLNTTSQWSRCGSFSSSSNDSAVFYNNLHVQNSDGKRLTNTCSTNLIKRHRNSSGSSIASNMSCISDKDPKKSCATTTSSSQISIGNSMLRNNGEVGPRLNCPEMHPASFNLKHEPLLNEHLPFSNTSSTSRPSQHNLRSNIRKKTCSCDCTSTTKHTTVVVRRYKEIGKKTVEEETVISSTKVQTYVQNKPTQEIHNVSYEKSYSPCRSNNKKRKSEVDKLYESLHNIEWAKHFSPENILGQLNVRQAASGSAFGRPSNDKSSSEERPPKISKTHNQSTKPKIPPKRKNGSFRDYPARNFSLRSESRKGSKQSEDGTFSDVSNSSNISVAREEKPSYTYCLQNSCDSKAIDHFNLQNCKSKPDIIPMLSDKSSPLSYNSVQERSFTEYSTSMSSRESPSLISDDINLDVKFESAENLNYPYYDIIEGLHKIPCCRNIGAEVVISTCDNGAELPLLTPINQNNLSDKPTIFNEHPPVLKQVDYDSMLDFPNPCNDSFDTISCCAESTFSDGFDSVLNGSTESLELEKALKKFNFTSVNHSLNNLRPNIIAKKIIQKYLKFLRTKARNQTTRRKKEEKPVPKNNLDLLPFARVTRSGILNKNISIPNENNAAPVACSNAVVSKSSFSFKSQELNYQTSNTNSNSVSILKSANQVISLCNPGTSNYHYSHSRNSYSERTTSKSIMNESVTVQRSSNFIDVRHDSIASTSLVPGQLKLEVTSRSMKEDIQRPHTLAAFTCHYQTIKVHRNNGYTQVVLKETRRNSVFLTVETLTELKDIVRRAGHDAGCHTLIINGISDSFCLGLDLTPLIGPQKIKASNEIAMAVKNFIEALSKFKKPLVAVVTGPAYGLGMTILNHADVTIASDTATFCMPQSSLGYFPEGGATLTLPQAVGSTVAMDLILRGRVITAAEAKSIGLISEVLEARHLPTDIVSRVKMLNGYSLTSLETTKAMLKMRLHLELLTVLENEVKLLPKMWLSKSCQDALENASHSGLLAA